MKLFLCSHFSSVGSLIKEEIENKKVAFIPTASLREGYTGYVGSARKLFKKLGAIVTEIDISTEAYSTIQSVFEDADVIYFTGGNSFFLIDQLRKTGTDELLKKELAKGKLTLEKMAGRDWWKDNLVSLAGVYLPKERIEDSTTPAALVKLLDEKPQIQKIFLHFDNDNAGRKASLALKTILPSKYEVIDSPPPCGKDYNDFLCFQLGIHRNKTKERTNER